MKKKITNNFNIIKLSLASPEIIRSWSFGEVKKPETINYRTFKPERDGLFCSKIFGPIKDYECLCGKYKRIKYKGITCEKCGVEIIKSKYRRDRMGHIELVSPVSHIWFLKSLPSKISLLLDISIKDIENVIYFNSYIITKSTNEKFKVGKIISENEYNELYNDNTIEIKIGAEAIQYLLKSINLKKELNILKLKINNLNCLLENKIKKIYKRIEIIESFIKSNNKPEWMILNVLPVLPPDLRPLVPLDGGRFATSDLNDLYRRVINRNNRLKRLIDLCAPDIIIKNEKRMLQESVDSLLDNGRQEKVAFSSNKRQLKSLSDMIKGKQGRFRQNLLGKRVDYSGRSVITVGPYLKLNQCGIPKKMALELFKPFLYNKLIEKGISNNLKLSKKIVDNEDPLIWDILSNIIKDHPILLNRAPTLHRLGIQAFDPILIEGKSIQLHPLVCTAYNADFDGDQMAIHIPISIESQLESRILMMSTNNILSPANGEPVIMPSQDIILGIYYMTMDNNEKRNDIIFSNLDEVKIAYNNNLIYIHSKIKVRITEYIYKNNDNFEKIKSIYNTTTGRILFWEKCPKGIKFSKINKCLKKIDILYLINFYYKILGIKNSIKFIDDIMYIGFYYATKSGISVGIDDLKIPKSKNNIIKNTKLDVKNIQEQYQNGLITNDERYNKIINIWSNVSDNITNDLMNELSDINNNKNIYESLNSIYIMYDSGSRGSSTQIRQLSGIRGLMTKPDGHIIETPIVSNFKEGLNVMEYFISTHGARKGLADTALKTANSGYLTRRLVDVAQDLVIQDYDCNTNIGIYINNILENNKLINNIKEKIIGRFLSSNILINENIVINKDSLIDLEICKIIEKYNINEIYIRSVIYCESSSICSKCYGIDLSTNKLVIQGEAVGVIAAQSIGEPGTQLTMRTFHIGGVTSSNFKNINNNIISKSNGFLNLINIEYIKNKYNQLIVISKNSEITIENNNIINERHKVFYGSIIHKNQDDYIKIGDLILSYDNYYIPIISKNNGISKFVNINEYTTINKINNITGINNLVILEYFDRENKYKNLLTKINIIDDNNIYSYNIPEKSIIQINENEYINKGDIIAKIPRNINILKDITGGLPKIADIFEARKPKNLAILAENSGRILISNFSKNKIKIKIISEKNKSILNELLISKNKQLNVLDGDYILKGDIISDGNISLQNILKFKGINELIKFIINEVQSIYKLQGVKINDKHIEIIIKQMLKKVSIISKGDSELNKNILYDYIYVKKINDNLYKENKKLIKYKFNIIGITKSSLITDSFISSSSFQETTKVLTEAAILGKEDHLKGLKENVIVGRLIPAGTGYYIYNKNKK